MKNIDEKILMAEEEIKQLQNKKSSLVSRNRKKEKRERRLYEKGAVFESIFNESKDFTKDEFYQLITFPNIKEAINKKILKIIEKREEKENKITENQEEERERSIYVENMLHKIQMTRGASGILHIDISEFLLPLVKNRAFSSVIGQVWGQI